MSDPLAVLPPETVLAILSHLPLPSIIALESVSTAWNRFLRAHDALIYLRTVLPTHAAYLDGRDLGSPSGPWQPPALERSYSQHRRFATDARSFARHSYLVERNWRPPPDRLPVIREKLIYTCVWRFRPDFDARFILCSTPHRHILSIDMDTHRVLWQIRKSDDGVPVRPYAHLEYADGFAVFDRHGEGVEVWKHLGHEEGYNPMSHPLRGHFGKVALLPHNRRIRGFMLRKSTLCVISDQGAGFVYELHRDRVMESLANLEIQVPHGAVGHLEQNEDTVMYSFGQRGYRFYSKLDGSSLGSLDPKELARHLSPSRNFFHLERPPIQRRHVSSRHHFPLASADDPRIKRATLRAGRLPVRTDHVVGDEASTLQNDEWGAGMLWGDWMVGVSLWGRVFFCSDWRGVLEDASRAADTVSIIECDSGGSLERFFPGGWLSIAHGRVLFEAQYHIFVLNLPPRPGGLLTAEDDSQPIFALPGYYDDRGPPVSFMAMYDDHLMSTYAIFTMFDDQPNVDVDVDDFMFTKSIRIVDFSQIAEQAATGEERTWKREVDERVFEFV
ncbi:hypothetical protein ACQY0O_003515 [Thecaphora frezii]